MTTPNSICSDWGAFVVKFDEETQSWRAIDKAIPANDWTPEQKQIHDAVAPIMLSSADEVQRLGQQSGDPRIEDLTTLAAQYRRGFVTSVANYTSADAYLELTATSIVRLVNTACKAAS